jgi:flagellar hook-associated protein 1 FlgK
MSSTFLGLEIGKSGLSSASLNIDIAGQNISNADTDGYTRKRVNSQSKVPPGSNYVISQTYNKLTGQGVETTGIEQIRSDYLDTQYRANNTNYNTNEYIAQSYSYMESLFDQSSSSSSTTDTASLTANIKSFYSALGKYADSDTTSQEYRTNVQQAAISLTENFNTVYSEMTSLWQNQNDSIATVANEINSATQQIASLNKDIANYEISGQTANDLRDQRNLLLDKLSGYVNIDYSTNETNSSMVDVSIGGVSVVKGNKSSNVIVGNSTLPNTCTGEYVNELKVQTGTDTSGNAEYTSLTMGNQITGGELYAHMQMTTGDTDENEGIPYYMSQLNSLAQDIAKSVNDVHLKGYTYPDSKSGTVSQSNTLFFDATQVTTSSGDAVYTTNDGAQVIKGTGGVLQKYDSATGTTTALTATIGANSYNNLTLSSDGTYFVGTDTATSTSTNLYLDSSGAFHLVSGPDATTGAYTYTDSASKTQTISSPAVVGVYDYSKVTAGNFDISDAVKSSVWNCAFSSGVVNLSAVKTTNSGNNEIGISIYKTLGNDKFDSKLNTIVAHFSSVEKKNQNSLDTNETLKDSTSTQRTSLSGVSMDEETTNLLQYKQMYSVCSRMITTVDDMLSTLINNTGRVGLS